MKTKLKPATRADFDIRPAPAEVVPQKKLVAIDRNTWVLTGKINTPDDIIKDNFKRKLEQSQRSLVYASVAGGNRTAASRRNAGRKPVQDDHETPETGFEFNDD